MPDAATLVALFAASIGAGFIDAIIGGGGLILIPALLVSIPTLPPVSALATNKVAAVCGTATAAVNYLRRVPLPRGPIALAVVIAALSAGGGAAAASSLDPQLLRPIIIVALVSVGIYVALKPSFGTAIAGSTPGLAHWVAAALLVAIIGGYDGIFGPGTGMFLVVGLTWLLRQSFLQATAAAKAINTATNIGALAVFIAGGHVHWALALILAGGNVLGALLGSRLVIARGTRLIRIALLIIVVVLAVKLSYDSFQLA